MNLGVIGDGAISLIATDDKIEWLKEHLLKVYEKGAVRNIFTYDGIGVPTIARSVAPKGVHRIVLSTLSYNTYSPLFSDLCIKEDNILEWVDELVIVSNGQPNPFYDIHRDDRRVYEINYQSKSAEWVTYT